MLKSSDYNIDPKLLADEINKMMPLVEKALDSIEDIIAYGKKELLKYLTENERVKALAFMYCFEGNTGETLNIKDLTANLNYIENDSALTYNENNLQYRDEITNLIEVADTLSGFIKIYFE